ncbi:hypothetical protein F4780DRAFT_202172 [Xylariomycetidae sp. FL0641]|nr:hypothetical protein F4780DRAFT_202172 [Xylariomycetidae sp. FL0641]
MDWPKRRSLVSMGTVPSRYAPIACCPSSLMAGRANHVTAQASIELRGTKGVARKCKHSSQCDDGISCLACLGHDPVCQSIAGWDLQQYGPGSQLRGSNPDQCCYRENDEGICSNNPQGATDGTWVLYL